MGRARKKQPRQNRVAQRGPERGNERPQYNTLRPPQQGVLPPRPEVPQHILAHGRHHKRNRNKCARAKIDRRSPTIKVERSSPKLDLSQIPLAPALNPPSRGTPPLSPSVQIRIETPSPTVKIETPNWHPAHSVRIEPPLGFFRSQAADSPMVLRRRIGNQKPLSAATEVLKRTMMSKVEYSPKLRTHLFQRGHQKPCLVPSPLAIESRPENIGDGLLLPLRGFNPSTPQQRCLSKGKRGESGEPNSTQALDIPTATPSIYQSQRGVKRLNLVEPIGPTRIILPDRLVKYVFDTTFGFLNREGAGEDAYQVTAYITANGDSSELYCGTFSSLEQANARVIKVFGRDPFQLMTARYADMVFREAAEPGQRDNDNVDEDPQNNLWTAFGFNTAYPTLRIWAKDDQEDWSFRVQAVRV
ncbi:hypothetical protein F4810DRAFT_38044 [Camillea tinctor]|nr:hypothetical protein F4810DRAFT_38044 [Camillea tinctor]